MQVEILRRIGKHANIVELLDVFESEKAVTLVFELMAGGELFERLVSKGPFKEVRAIPHPPPRFRFSLHLSPSHRWTSPRPHPALHPSSPPLLGSQAEAAMITRKLAEALRYLHKRGIVHRDLKPENLLLTSKADRGAELKIADFGLSRLRTDSSLMTTVCGTWAYSAPEVRILRAPYTHKVDLWSLGVIVFVLCSGYHPFDPEGCASEEELQDAIKHGRFDFDDPVWDRISVDAKDLICRLLVVNPAERLDTGGLLRHSWIVRFTGRPTRRQEEGASAAEAGGDGETEVSRNPPVSISDIHAGQASVHSRGNISSPGVDASPMTTINTTTSINPVTHLTSAPTPANDRAYDDDHSPVGRRPAPLAATAAPASAGSAAASAGSAAASAASAAASSGSSPQSPGAMPAAASRTDVPLELASVRAVAAASSAAATVPPVFQRNVDLSRDRRPSPDPGRRAGHDSPLAQSGSPVLGPMTAGSSFGPSATHGTTAASALSPASIHIGGRAGLGSPTPAAIDAMGGSAPVRPSGFAAPTPGAHAHHLARHEDEHGATPMPGMTPVIRTRSGPGASSAASLDYYASRGARQPAAIATLQ